MRELLKVLFTAFLMFSCSAETYPGGVELSPATEGFSIHLNYLTDLGRLYAYNGEINGFGSTFFVVALLLVVLVYGREVIALGLKYSSAVARKLVIAGGIVGGIVCLLFALYAADWGAWVIPFREPARALAIGLVPAALLLFAAAALIDPDIPGQVTVTWMAITLTVAVYSALVFWGPAGDTVGGLQSRVRAQQIVTALTLAGVVFIVWETRRALSIPEDD